MKAVELEHYLSRCANKPIYVQVGYNRFAIDTITDQGDHVLIHVSEDAENPVKQPQKVA